MTMTNLTTQHPVEPEELMAYLDGELSPDGAAETASHLEHCPECQALAAGLDQVSQKLIEWQIEASEPVLSERLSEALDEREQKKPESVSLRKAQMSFIKPKLLWAGGAAALLAVAIAISIQSLRKDRLMGFTSPQSAEVQQGRASQSAARSRATRQAPSAARRPARGTLGKIEGLLDGNGNPQAVTGNESVNVPAANGPMIVRTAELSLITNKFDHARAAVEEILKHHKGYVGELNVSTPTGSSRSLTGALRVPAAQLDAALADFKGLGRVEKESQGGEEVTQKYVDLEARLANAKHTEQRLTEMLRDRTGKLSDVLAVEMQISRVRGEIEEMEAERKSLKNQVDYATLNITVSEDYKAELKVVPPSTSTQIRNAAVEGYRNLTDGLLGVFLWLLSVLPALLVWCALLFFPVRYVWKKLRPRLGGEIVSP